MKTPEEKLALAEKWRAHNAAKRSGISKLKIVKRDGAWMILVSPLRSLRRNSWTEAVASALANIPAPVTVPDYIKTA